MAQKEQAIAAARNWIKMPHRTFVYRVGSQWIKMPRRAFIYRVGSQWMVQPIHGLDTPEQTFRKVQAKYQKAIQDWQEVPAV
jgi:hypothetical protein